MSVRTRYAPSPTGFLHVGGLRTALYNYLFARKHSGTYLLRIEDTDQSRKVEGAIENLIDIFDWLGVHFDEGPHVGGAFGPYVQSERLNFYRDYLQLLVAAGHAYPCFCTSDRLDQMRKEQNANGRVPMYDRRCRNLPKSEVERRIAAGEPHVWRMAVPDEQTVIVSDIIRGNVSFETSTIDDQVLLKSDGFPTYHLANVVDDHMMDISHVIRGEEWLPSTPKHVLLYEFLGWNLPIFAHLPLLLNADRSKMSKRSGDVAVEEYRNKGFLPDSLINFVALLGWHPSDDREIFSLEDLVSEFELERVNKAGAVFDLTKLRWMNAEYIKAESDETLFGHLKLLLADEIRFHGNERVNYAIKTFRGGAESYEGLAAKVTEAFAPLPPPVPEVMELMDSDSARAVVDDFAERMAGLELGVWNDFPRLEEEFKNQAMAAGQIHGLKGKTLWQPLRAALMRQPHGPELAKLIGI
jgi:glutamyl-tRNA synthetase